VLWSAKNNTLFFQIPKTGTTSVYNYWKENSPHKDEVDDKFRHWGRAELIYHEAEITEYLGKHIDTFEQFTFVRDPVERFISAANYTIRAVHDSRIPKFRVEAEKSFRVIFNDPKFDIQKLCIDDFYYALWEVYRNSIWPLSPREWLRLWCVAQKPKEDKFAFGNWDFFRPITPAYLTDAVSILDFRDFNNEFRKLCGVLDMPVGLPKHVYNKNKDPAYPVTLSGEVRQKLETVFYRQDYEFLAKKGMYF